MAAHARLKNELTEDEKYHNLMTHGSYTCTVLKTSYLSAKYHVAGYVAAEYCKLDSNLKHGELLLCLRGLLGGGFSRIITL